MTTTIEELVPAATPRLPITASALLRLETYAKLCPRHEIFGFLLSNPGGDVVDGVLLASEQQATMASVEISAEAVLRAGAEAGQAGKIVIGWWHSHADLPPFSSPTDDTQLLELADQLVLLNVRTRPHEIPGIGVVSARFSQTYSLVVNARSIAPEGSNDRPFGKVCTKSWCPCCGREEIVSEEAPVIVVPDVLDEAALRAELSSKVRVVDPFRVNGTLFRRLFGGIGAGGGGS